MQTVDWGKQQLKRLCVQVPTATGRAAARAPGRRHVGLLGALSTLLHLVDVLQLLQRRLLQPVLPPGQSQHHYHHEMRMQLWRPELELAVISSGSWCHCLPIRTCL